jgi:CrcB protein
MSPELAVAAGAAVGAPARYLLDRWVRSPWGILLVNLLGCVAAGMLVGLGPSELLARLVGLGFLGSFTTASTVAWDVLTRRSPMLLALHVLPGLALAGLGVVVGRAL